MTLAHRLERWPTAPVELTAPVTHAAPGHAPIARGPAQPARPTLQRSGAPAELWVRVTLGAVVAGLLLYLGTVRDPPPTRAMVGKERAIAELRWTLMELRAVISDYKADHGAFPGRAPNGSSDPGWFERQLTLASNRSGETAENSQPTHPLGPYEPGGVPKNPITELSSVRFLAANEPWPAAADGSTGWTYRPATGEIRANALGTAFGTGRRYWDL